MLDLLDKDFKEAVINLLQQAIENMLETKKAEIFRIEIESLRKK